MTYFDLQAEAAAKTDLQLLFPKPDSVAIASTTIGQNEQTIGIRIVARTNFLPPCTDRIYGKLGSIATGANTYKALVLNNVIDTVWDRNTIGVRGEIMIQDFYRFLAPSAPGLMERSY